MSPPPINRSTDLQKLHDDGYEVEIREGHLAIHSVPYVNAQKQVKRGTLVSILDLAGDVTTAPGTHVAMFAGDYPCDAHGRPLLKIQNSSAHQVLCDGLAIDHTFS